MNICPAQETLGAMGPLGQLAPPDVKAAPPPELSKADKEKHKFYEMMKEKNWLFNAQGAKGNPAGGKWQRFIDKDTEESKAMKAEYQKLPRNSPQQQAFRADWLRKQYETWQDGQGNQKGRKLGGNKG